MLKFKEWLAKRGQLKTKRPIIKSKKNFQFDAEKELDNQEGKILNLESETTSRNKIFRNKTFKELRNKLDDYSHGLTPKRS